MAKMGRPKIPDPDWAAVEKMIAVQNTQEDIAYILGMSVDTLSRKMVAKYGVTFAELYKQKKAWGKDKIRKAMWNAAINGSVPMLIWLSKNWLGMRDQPEDVVTVKPTIIKLIEGKGEIELGTTEVKLDEQTETKKVKKNDNKHK